MGSREENTQAKSSKSTSSAQKELEKLEESMKLLEAENSQIDNELENILEENRELKKEKDCIMEDLSQMLGLPISDIAAIIPDFQAARNSDEQSTSSEREQTERKELETLEALARLKAKNSQLKNKGQNLDEQYREDIKEHNRLKRDLAQLYGLESSGISANIPDFHGARNSDEQTNSSEKEPTGRPGPNAQPRDDI